MITIRPVSRYNQFSLTSEHPVLAIKREGVRVKRKARRNGWLPEVDTKKLLAADPEWIPAGQLAQGDFVLVPKLQQQETAGFSDQETELLGYYLAEGSSYHNKANKQHTNQFSFGLQEKDLIAQTRSLIEDVTGRPSYLTEQPDRNGAGVSFLLPTVRRLVHRTLRQGGLYQDAQRGVDEPTHAPSQNSPRRLSRRGRQCPRPRQLAHGALLHRLRDLGAAGPDAAQSTGDLRLDHGSPRRRGEILQ